MAEIRRFHMRRTDKEISDKGLLEKILKSTEYVTIAMSVRDQPYLVSLSHCYDEERGCIYFHCANEGMKLEYLKSNNSVWGQALIDHGYKDGECTHLFASVHFSGNIELVEDLAEKRRAMECMMKQLDGNPKQLFEGLNQERLNRVVIGRINIGHMTGKKSEEVTI
jgi:nitroimidazol reductase NimA-like FMN-containing flavoprotein (pyridoxamine 5'-phosphate oxidase superfamily)